MSDGPLEILEDIKERMISGRPLDVALAFRIEACIASLRAQSAPTRAPSLTVPSQPPENLCVDKVSTPKSFEPGGEPRVFVADSIEGINSVIRDETMQEGDGHASGAFGGVAERIGGMFRRE